MIRTLIVVVLSFSLCASAQSTSARARYAAIPNADTKAWWQTTEDLSSNAMEGRDTGSADYERAAAYVAERFRNAGLVPAGENGTYFQQVPLHEVALVKTRTSFQVMRGDRSALPLEFLHQISLSAQRGLPARLEAPLVFRGYCGSDDMKGVTGAFVVCFGTRRAGMTSAAQRLKAAHDAGAVGIITVDDASFTLEPPRWPDAYARSLSLAEGGMAPAPAFPSMRLAAGSFAGLILGAHQDAAAILAAGGASKSLPSFDIPSRLRITTATTQRELTSPNVLAVLPGSDPVLKHEYVVISAHLDGYGHGEPVAGDSVYNGTLDDAAYVALLIQFAEGQRRLHTPLKRSVLFCAFTGEEKGLLGSRWFTEHLTVPKEALVADVNLDQLRPLFPLHILTASAVDDTSLGQTAREVAAPMDIEIRSDREPERGLLRRADNWPFLQIGVPAIGFIFGYDPNTDAERRYREWYRTEYHRPQDDLAQPVDFDAAKTFNTFFYTLTRTLADAAARPSWSTGSSLRPKG